MPLLVPSLDDRRYQDLLDEALARIPVHNPEWTNFNKSDPGVTLVEVFAFLTETLLYRCNLVPERNRRKFLSLLGVPLQPASSAQGLVVFANERGPLSTITLNAGLEVRAGQVPFRTERGLDVLPIEAQVYYKKAMPPDDQVRAYYQQLYASHAAPAPATTEFQLYQTTLLPTTGTGGIDLGNDAVDGSLWIALLVRATDKPYDQALPVARDALANRTISLGVVPALADASRTLTPGGRARPDGVPHLQFQLPNVAAASVPSYSPLVASASVDVLAEPGVVEVTLPGASQLTWWDNLGPLDAGVGDLPPALDDATVSGRVITWLRVRSATVTRTQLMWVGINATSVSQRAHVANEQLPNGTGEPDQVVVLSRRPLIPGSVQLTVQNPNGTVEQWQAIDDLSTAGPEVPAPDPRQPPGVPPVRNPLVRVFSIDAESGEMRFGDGTRGKRPPAGALLRADYDYGLGAAGNVGPRSINTSPALPGGLKVSNPVRTWGGAQAETARDGEKQIARYLQHRDRLVNAADFETVTWRTPGVDLGRVDIIPAFNPELAPNGPGDAPGAVTVMVIPRFDPSQPDAPLPDQLFLDTIAAYLEQRRLVTTELFLCPPTYRPIWVSVGIDVLPSFAVAQVTDAVKQALRQFLSPLPSGPGGPPDDTALALGAAPATDLSQGWPLRKSVVDLELAAQASRVAGVLLVRGVLLADGSQPGTRTIPISGLELPRIIGISVALGDPIDIDQLRGQVGGQGAPGSGGTGGPGLPPNFLPVPVIPEECR